MNALVASVKAWVRAPFTQPLSLGGYALIIGATIVIVALWQIVLQHIAAGIREA